MASRTSVLFFFRLASSVLRGVFLTIDFNTVWQWDWIMANVFLLCICLFFFMLASSVLKGVFSTIDFNTVWQWAGVIAIVSHLRTCWISEIYFLFDSPFTKTMLPNGACIPT